MTERGHPCYRCNWRKFKGQGATKNVVFCPVLGLGIMRGNCLRVRKMDKWPARNHIIHRLYLAKYEWYRRASNGEGLRPSSGRVYIGRPAVGSDGDQAAKARGLVDSQRKPKANSGQPMPRTGKADSLRPVAGKRR